MPPKGATLRCLKEETNMARHIESKKGLESLLERMENLKGADKLPEFEYWFTCVSQCIDEGLAMDETDWENAPEWFRPLWRGLK